jgi:hypothetical protein
MAAPDLVVIADAIVDAARSSNLRATAFERDGDWQPPELLVPIPQVEQLTFGADGVWSLRYELLLIVASASDRAAHVNLNDLLAPLKTRLQADQTLGGSCRTSWVRSIRPDDQIRDRQEVEWFGSRLDLEVQT